MVKYRSWHNCYMILAWKDVKSIYHASLSFQTRACSPIYRGPEWVAHEYNLLIKSLNISLILISKISNKSTWVSYNTVHRLLLNHTLIISMSETHLPTTSTCSFSSHQTPIQFHAFPYPPGTLSLTDTSHIYPNICFPHLRHHISPVLVGRQRDDKKINHSLRIMIVVKRLFCYCVLSAVQF